MCSRYEFDSGRHIRNIHDTLKKIFAEWNLFQFWGPRKGCHNCITKVLQQYKSNTQNLMCLRKKELFPLCGVYCCVLTHLFLLSTLFNAHQWVVRTADLFSQKTRRIFYCTLYTHIMSLAFSRLACVCWAAISLLFHFHFQWSVWTKPLMPAPNTNAHTHPHKCKQKHIIFCFVTAFFVPAKRIYIHHNALGENLISSARKIPHFHYEQRLQCSRVNHHVADRKYKRNVASDIVDVFLFVCRCGFWKTEISHLLKYTHIHSSCSSDDGNNFCQSHKSVPFNPHIHHPCRISFYFHLLGFICTFPLEKLQCENNYSHNKVATIHTLLRFMLTSTFNWLCESECGCAVSVNYVRVFLCVCACLRVWNFSAMSSDAWNSAFAEWFGI